MASGVEMKQVLRLGATPGKIIFANTIKSEEDIAIAQILPGWLQMPIQKGDRLVYERIMR